MSEKNADMLRAVDVAKHYYRNETTRTADGSVSRKTIIKAVGGVSLSIRRGELVGILGETGCGKSTLGRLLAGLEQPTSGSIELGGVPVGELYRKDRKALRRKAQMIFQNPFEVFDPRHKIERVLEGTLALHGICGNKAERLQKVSEALESSGLRPAADYLSRYPNELSGGQLQRIAILRSMLLTPGFVVADEPVSMLDVSIRADIINLLYRLTHEENTAVLFISHDISTTRYIADRIAVMYLGQIVEMAPTQELIKHPLHPYTQALISNCPSSDPRAAFHPITLAGEPPSPAELPNGCYFSPRCPLATAACREESQTLSHSGSDEHFVRCSNILYEEN